MGASTAFHDRVPVVLVYGFQPVPGFQAAKLWVDFAHAFSGRPIEELQRIPIGPDQSLLYLAAADAEHTDVYISDYALNLEPTARELSFYIKRLLDELIAIATVHGTRTIDLIGHSMGGLLGRAIVESADLQGAASHEAWLPRVDEAPDFRTLILLATPNHGTEFATVNDWFSQLSRQLAPRSDFLTALNADRWVNGGLTSLNPDVRYVSMAGQTCLGCGLRLDADDCRQSCVEEGLAWEGSDLAIMMRSAYLSEGENVALIGFDHARVRTDEAVIRVIRSILAGAPVPRAIFSADLERFAPEMATDP